MANTLTLQLTVSGQLGQFPITKEVTSFIASGKALTGPKAILVPAGAAPAAINVTLEEMSRQLVLLLCATQRVTYQINNDGVNRELAEGSFAVHPGNPVITQLAFGGNGLTESEVSVFQIGNEGSPPSSQFVLSPELQAILDDHEERISDLETAPGGGLPPLPGNTGFPPVLLEEPTGVLIFRPLTSADLAPPFGASLSGGQVVEIGQSIINPTFNATYVGGTPTSASLADDDGNPSQDVLGVPNPITRPHTYVKTGLNASVDFTLTADDGTGPEVDIETSRWRGRTWWGTGAAGGSTEAFIKALANTALDNNRQRTFTVNAGVGEKIYYAYPSAYGVATFKVGGFEGGFLPGVTISLTNAFGVTLDYLLYESSLTGLGSTEVVVS